MFWRGLQEYLKSRVREHAKIPDIYRQSFLVVISGEVADNPEFLDTIRRTIADIQKDPIHRTMETGTVPKIELLISEDPTYAAAKGVAFGQRMMMDSSYCDDWFQREERKHKTGQGIDEERHGEL